MARPLRIEYPGALYHVTGVGSGLAMPHFTHQSFLNLDIQLSRL
ncbi:MAG: hypothetical protein O3A59_13295 [Nitrospirae bacterium]|nr:hypothetical protein [Nitrospirota bacterium]